jgi:hypothetical protein
VALILEVLHGHGARTRHRLDALPLTVGRALTNDIVLDDAYVDARHARITRDESGALQVEDLGSVNGLVAGGRRQGSLPVQPGSELRVGRTTLRFRDPDEPVPPPLVDELPGQTAPTPAAADGGPRVGATPGFAARRAPAALALWVATTNRGRLLLAAGATVAFAIYTWLGSSERSSASDVFSTALGFVTLTSMWAGIWAVASRAVVRRFEFLGHFAVASAVALAGLAWTIAEGWASFLFPDTALTTVLSTAPALALLAALIAGHLALASTLPRRRQWRAALIVTGTVVAIAGLAALTSEEEFTDVPTFSAALKPVPTRWLPTKSIDDFGGVMRELKEDVDEMAAK